MNKNTLLAVEVAETQRRPQGTHSPVLFLLALPGLWSRWWPVQPQGRCAKFGVLGVKFSSGMSWLGDCRQVGFLIHQTGHTEVPVAQGEVPMGGMVCGEGWAHSRC